MSQEEALHVIPVDDLREHETAPTCWCTPTEEEETPGLWVHHSMDQREAYETGERLPQ